MNTPSAPTTRERIITAVSSNRDALIQLSHSIGNRPELSFQEFQASDEVASLLEGAGFSVTRGAYDLPTAVEAVYGDGDCTVAVVAEYDALPGVGHACGHNVIAGAAVGAALALKDVAAELNLRVKLLGTPAEEAGGGKILMLEQGAWDDVDFSLMVHGMSGPQRPCESFTTQAVEHLSVRFTGRSSHAAAAPHEGVNAGDAATLTQVALGLLRQQLKSSVVVASVVESAGAASNVIPASSNLQVETRAFDEADWSDAKSRVRACIEGAAMATGCQVHIEQTEKPYAPMQQDKDIASYWDANLRDLGYVLDMSSQEGGGSTDMGNISQYLPSIHPALAFQDCDVAPHTIEFAKAALSPAGDNAVIDGAMALALTTANVAADQELRTKLNRMRTDRAPRPSAASALVSAAT